jgi:cytoskeletal protein CcmA (bactofilin family)
MWKWKEEEKPISPAVSPQPPVRSAVEPVTAVADPKVAPKEVRPVETPKPFDTFRADIAHIGKSVIIKGELSGSEDLYVDGEVQGNIELPGHSLIIGPNGRVRAAIHAKDVVIHGKVDGNVRGTQRVELKKSAILVGDLVTQRVVIEDGAYFKGGIDIQKEAAKPEPKPEPKPAPKPEVAQAVAAPSISVMAGQASSAGVGQTKLLEKK